MLKGYDHLAYKSVLSIDPGPSGIVEVVGLIVSGSQLEGNGGGVSVTSGTATFSDCTIRGNT